MGTVDFSSIKLVKGGTIQGDDKATGTVPTTEQYVSFGGAADKWGLALSDTDVNASDFGVVFSFVGVGNPGNFTTHYIKATNFSFSIPEGATINGVVAECECRDSIGEQILIDHVRVTVYYTEEAPAGTNMQVNVDDAWKAVSAIKVNVDDAWKAVASAKVNVDDAWKTIF